MYAMSDNKRKYLMEDMHSWTRLWRAVMKQAGFDAHEIDEIVQLNWPDIFPIKSVAALRIAILEPATIDCICKCNILDLFWQVYNQILNSARCDFYSQSRVGL
jgi:hypothetical protein